MCSYLKRHVLLWKIRSKGLRISVCQQHTSFGIEKADHLFFICLPFRSLWKHFRAVSLCLFLLIFPAYMAYMICQFFHMDFWLLIIISSSILTSLQVNIHTQRAYKYSSYKTGFTDVFDFFLFGCFRESYHNKHIPLNLNSKSFTLNLNTVLFTLRFLALFSSTFCSWWKSFVRHQ